MNRKDGVTSAGGGGGGQVGEREVQIKKMTNEYKDPPYYLLQATSPYKQLLSTCTNLH